MRRLWRVPIPVLASHRPATSRLWLVPMKYIYFVSILHVFLVTVSTSVPAGVGPIDLGSAAGLTRFGAHLGTGSGKIRAGLGEEQLGLDGLGEEQRGLGTAGAAEWPAGGGGAGGGRGGAGTKSGSLAASGSCTVWSPEAERRRE